MGFLRAGTVAGSGETTGMVASGLTGAPSNPNAGASGRAPRTNAIMVRLDIRIALFLVRTARMGHGPIHRRPNLLGIFPQRTRRMVGLSGLPFGSPFSELGVGQLYVKSSDIGVDLDDVTILQQGDRAADRRFRPDMADTEAAGGAREPAVGDQGDLAALRWSIASRASRGRRAAPHSGSR